MEPNTDLNQPQNPTPAETTAPVQATQPDAQQVPPAPATEQPKEEGKSFLEHITGLFNRGKKPQTPESPQS